MARDSRTFLASGSKSDAARATEVGNILAALNGGGMLADVVPRGYLAIFLHSEGGPARSLDDEGAARGSVLTLASDLAAEQTRLVELREQLKTAETIERTDALVTIVDDIVTRYDRGEVGGGACSISTI